MDLPSEVYPVVRRALEFFMVQHERDQLLKEKLSVIHNMMIADRIVSLGLLAQGLSQHIRNPLQAVRTFMDLAPLKIEEEKRHAGELRDPEFWQEYYKNAQSQLDKITHLLNELWCAPERPSMGFVDKLKMGAVVEAEIQNAKAALETKNISVTNNIPADLPEIGEADLGNALPWDTVKAAAYSESNRVGPSLAALRTGSEKRIAKDPDFTDLKADIARFSKLRADKSVSLNEAKRQQEKDELKARNEAAEKARLARGATPPPAYEVTLKNYRNPGLGDPVKPEEPVAAAESDSGEDEELTAPSEDIVLREAQNILIDYAALLKGQPVVSQR